MWKKVHRFKTFFEENGKEYKGLLENEIQLIASDQKEKETNDCAEYIAESEVVQMFDFFSKDSGNVDTFDVPPNNEI